jgi:hypothetical protein
MKRRENRDHHGLVCRIERRRRKTAREEQKE